MRFSKQGWKTRRHVEPERERGGRSAEGRRHSPDILEADHGASGRVRARLQQRRNASLVDYCLFLFLL